MNENIKTQNKEIIAPAMRKCKKIGKSIIIPNIDFSNTKINSSNIKDNKKNNIWTSCTSWIRKWKIKKSWTIRRKNWRTLRPEIELDEKYYGYN